MRKLFLLFLIGATSFGASAAVEGTTLNDNPTESRTRQNDNPTEGATRSNDNPTESSKRQNDNPSEGEAVKKSASQGEPLFDWKKHKGETEVAHPFAEKGLIRIDKDDVYYYKTEDGIYKHTALSFQLGLFNPTNLVDPNIRGQANSTFQDNYHAGGVNAAFLLDKEWPIWRGVLGKLMFRGGTGVFTASGHGHFVDYPNLTPMENFTFLAFPSDVAFVYRMQFVHRQLFVPYAQGGGVLIPFAELRDDTRGPKFAGALAGYFAAGMEFNLTYFDYLTRVQLSREYGISAVYLTLEDRQQIGIGHYDFTLNMFNLGFLIEY